VGHSRVNPSAYFRPTAQPISSSPATSRATHAMMRLRSGAVPARDVSRGRGRPRQRGAMVRRSATLAPAPPAASAGEAAEGPPRGRGLEPARRPCADPVMRLAALALASVLATSACDGGSTDDPTTSDEQDLVGGKAESRFQAVGYLAAA